MRLAALALAVACIPMHATAGESWWSQKFVDPEDGKLDASAFLESAYGFVPIGTIITDPAIGYGGGLGLVFIQPNKFSDGRPARPDMSLVGAFATDNGSWGAALGDSRNWHDERIKTLAGAFHAELNLTFSGLGDLPEGTHLGYALHTSGALAEMRGKLGASRTWIGVRYVFADVQTRFDGGNDVPGIEAREYDQQLSGLTPLLSFDSRDNIFTPVRGTFAEAGVAVFDEALGGDSNFQIMTLTGMWFHPLGEQLHFGMRANMAVSSDGTPFYLRPYVQLRGVESLALQGEAVGDLEAELRWQRWSRFSLLAFAGTGGAWQEIGDTQRERTTASGGVGFRYLVARAFGLHMGLDVGFGPDDPIIYFQFGHAWFRP